ncbi:MAG: RDD family protein [Thiohalocapsa sp.]
MRLAGPIPRAAAQAIDWLLRLVLYLVLAPLAAFSGVGVGLMLLGLFLVEWFYPVWFELRSGATPGKKAMGLLVVHDDGTPVGPSASLIRNLLRALDFLPLLYATGLISMLIDRDFRRLGDLAGGTLVIYADGRATDRCIPKHPPRALTGRLDTDMQQAILDFAERSPRLSPARCAELAELATGRRDGQDRRGEAAVADLLGIASWIARGR